MTIQVVEASTVDFTALLPALVNLGPWGIVIGLALYLRHEHGKELDKKDATIAALSEGRYSDAKATLEARVVAEREFQRVVSESTAATVRVTAALESVTDTLREVAEAARIEREIARREAGRGTSA